MKIAVEPDGKIDEVKNVHLCINVKKICQVNFACFTWQRSILIPTNKTKQ